MDAELKAKWVKALRSGEYKQSIGFLEDKTQQYCCLGVLCLIQGVQPATRFRYTNISSLPPDLGAGLGCEAQWELAEMNDSGESFSEIADYIEANL